MSQAHGPAPGSTDNAIVLARDPFAARAPVPFRDAHCTRLLAQLNHLIDKTELLAMVSGPAGSGKSVLSQMFIDQVPKHFVVLSIDAAGGLRSVDLLAKVVERFGNRRRKNDDIQDLFTRHYSRGKQPVLVIDAAEHLEARALHLAARLAEHGLHLVLFVRTNRERYLAEHLDAERIQVLRVAAYDQRRTYCYLQHCLVSAGYQGPMPFDAAALADIGVNSDGTPAGINRIAHKRLLDGPTPSASAAPRPSAVGGRVVGPRLVLLGALLAMILGVLAVLGLTGRLGGDDRRAESVAEVPRALEADERPPASTAVPVDGDEVDVGTTGATAIDAAVDMVDEPRRDETPVEVNEPEEPSAEVQVDVPGPGPVPASLAAEAEVIEVPESVESQELDVVSEAPTSSDALMEVSLPRPAPEPVPEVPDEQVDEADDETAAPAQAVGHATGPLSPDNDSIRARNPRHFTMQLISGPSLKAVRRFADRYEVGPESAIYRFDRDGKPQYALIYRNYATRAEALTALDELPDKLKARKPWLRRISAIQRAIGED